jgi:membrane-associated phospholipid phosphatase
MSSFGVCGLVLVLVLGQPWAASAQVATGAQDPRVPRPQGPSPAAASLRQPAAGEPAPETGGFSGFLRDVGRDYRGYFTRETAAWLAGGAVSSLAFHVADQDIRDAAQEPEPPDLAGGTTYGNAALQIPLAAGWWAVAHAMGSARGADAGRDLLRAQINSLSLTFAIKYAVNRTRPNGDPHSFPSGHSTATFATAMVLQEHYGWKLGLPAFAAAAYTAASRVTDNKHWASDVVFGAAVGMASGRTVTLHLHTQKVVVGPEVVPGGAALVARLGE